MSYDLERYHSSFVGTHVHQASAGNGKKSLFLGHLRHLRIPNELCDKWEAKPQAKRCHLQIATQPGGVRGFW